MIKQVYMQTGKGLGTEIELRLVTFELEKAENVFKTLWKEISGFENRFSRFKTDSELTYLNENAGKMMPVSKELRDILEASKKFSDLTSGIFNPFILPEIQRAGYVHSMTGGSNSPQLDYSDRRVVDIKFLEIKNDSVLIPGGTAIDLGGIGKGYLADLLAKLLDGVVEDYCLSLGGDIICKGLDVDKEWDIDIQSNRNRNENVATYSHGVEIYAVATSAVTRIKKGKEQMHLINPRDIPTQNEYDMCSVVAKDATTADVMASCILIDGKNLASELVRNNIVIAVLLQRKGDVLPVVLGKGFNLCQKNH